MHTDTKRLTKTSQALLYVLAASDIMYRSKLRGQLSKAFYPEYRNYLANRRAENILFYLHRHGYITYRYKEADKIIKLTKKGELEALLEKAKLNKKSAVWDGKWRMILFDIPEHAVGVRDKLRRMLKEFGFKALQASVYIYPFALNTDAAIFLKKSGLMRYIRMAKVEAFDDDKDLLKSFRSVIGKMRGRAKV